MILTTIITINQHCHFKVCKSLSSEESWGSSEEGYQYRNRYQSADMPARSADHPPANKMAAEGFPRGPELQSSPLPRVKVTQSMSEEEELVPSVPLASEDSDLGESGDFESFSDGEEHAEEEAEEGGGLRTPGQHPGAINLK
jgi:hypothetical protein